MRLRANTIRRCNGLPLPVLQKIYIDLIFSFGYGPFNAGYILSPFMSKVSQYFGKDFGLIVIVFSSQRNINVQAACTARFAVTVNFQFIANIFNYQSDI